MTEYRECRVCGKKFKPCQACGEHLGMFNYKTICCSPECGAEYFEQVRISREQPETITEKPKKSKKEKIEMEVKDPVIEITEDLEMPLEIE